MRRWRRIELSSRQEVKVSRREEVTIHQHAYQDDLDANLLVGDKLPRLLAKTFLRSSTRLCSTLDLTYHNGR